MVVISMIREHVEVVFALPALPASPALVCTVDFPSAPDGGLVVIPVKLALPLKGQLSKGEVNSLSASDVAKSSDGHVGSFVLDRLDLVAFHPEFAVSKKIKLSKRSVIITGFLMTRVW